MNRDDWTVVGMRLFGVWLITQVLLAIAPASIALSHGAASVMTGTLIGWGVQLVIGVLLTAGAGSLAAAMGGGLRRSK